MAAAPRRENRGGSVNAERILQAVDSHLDHEVSLVIYGRAAIALGFANPPASVTRTLDVDAIIPVAQEVDFSSRAGEFALRMRFTSANSRCIVNGFTRNAAAPWAIASSPTGLPEIMIARTGAPFSRRNAVSNSNPFMPGMA
jgi:hypothetical protein